MRNRNKPLPSPLGVLFLGAALLGIIGVVFSVCTHQQAIAQPPPAVTYQHITENVTLTITDRIGDNFSLILTVSDSDPMGCVAPVTEVNELIGSPPGRWVKVHD